MKEDDRKLVEAFREKLSAGLRQHISRIIGFGSRVRGDARDDSDLDVAVLVDEKTPEIEKAIDDTAYSLMWKHDFRPIVSLKVFSEKRFRQASAKGLSFYRHVEREGVSL
jgi:uncharacterized protein